MTNSVTMSMNAATAYLLKSEKMTTVADVPAFFVVDLNEEVIDLTFEVLQHMRFCVNKETARHGNLYPEVSPNCSAYYAMEYNEDPDASMAQCAERGHEQFWINNCGSSITAHQRAKYILVLLKPGQLVKMYGQTLKVEQIRKTEHYRLVAA